MDIILNFFAKLVTGMISREEITSWQGFFIFLFTATILVAAWKAKSMWDLFKNVRRTKLDELSFSLKEYDLSDIIKDCLRGEISRIVGYRLCGLPDTARQNIALALTASNNDLISPDLFRKFRNYLKIEEGFLILKTSISFWIDCFFYYLFALQYLLIAMLFIALSISKGNMLTAWKQVFIYLLVMILLFLSQAFIKLIPLPKERRLMSVILQKQYGIQE